MRCLHDQTAPQQDELVFIHSTKAFQIPAVTDGGDIKLNKPGKDGGKKGGEG